MGFTCTVMGWWSAYLTAFPLYNLYSVVKRTSIAGRNKLLNKQGSNVNFNSWNCSHRITRAMVSNTIKNLAGCIVLQLDWGNLQYLNTVKLICINRNKSAVENVRVVQRSVKVKFRKTIIRIMNTLMLICCRFLLKILKIDWSEANEQFSHCLSISQAYKKNYKSQ